MVKPQSMPTDQVQNILRNYLTPSADACWRWDETGESVVWRDGTTIAFWSEIAAILRSFNDRGWPSFSALVLVLAACRSTWSSVADANLAHAKELVQEAATREQVVLLWFARCLSGLQAVAELPIHQRESAEARLTLCRMVFSKGQIPGLLPETVMLILPLLPDVLGRPPSHGEDGRYWPKAGWWPTLRTDLYALSIGLAELSEERLALKTKTGVEELPAPATDIPPTTSTQVRQVLDADDDDEIGFVVRLARSVLGALPMYQRLSEPDGLPLGGIVDLKNRGQLDHLVLSELANDDDVLTARLALSEALYLRRETPERTPDGARLILLDVGVRQWGTARLVSLAAALALAAQGDPRQPVHAWVAQGHGLREIDLGTRDGVVEALACLRPEPTPALALPAFVRQARARDELMVITGPRALADPELEQALSKAKYAGLIATTTSAGAFRLLHCGARGQRELAAAQLDLERCRIRPNRRQTTTMTAVDGTTADPINRITPFPLRLPHHLDLALVVALPGGEGVLSVSQRGHLTWWDDPDAGPRRLLSDLPIGRVMALGRTDERLLWVLIHRRSDKRLVLCVSDDGSGYSVTELESLADADEIVTTWMVGDTLLVVMTRREITSYTFDGRLYKKMALPANAKWRHGQYLRDGQDWHRIHVDDDGFRLLRVVGPPGINSGRLINCLVLDIEQRDGPRMVDQLDLWKVVTTNTLSSELKIPPPPLLLRQMEKNPSERLIWRVSAASRNGQRLIFKADGRGGAFGYDVAKRQHFAGDSRLLEPGILAWTGSGQGIMSHINAVSVDQGCLRVHSQRGRAHIFEVHEGALRLRFEKVPTAKGKRLGLIPGGERHRRWYRADHNGVVVFLDGSGLLHLNDRQLPALALVLADGDTACWCSEGWVHGPRRFLGAQPSAPGSQVATLLDAYVRRLAWAP